MMWIAYYIPADGPKNHLWDKEFPTSEECWDYIYSRMCKNCKLERNIALTVDEDDYQSYYEKDIYPSTDPACSCEWGVMTKQEYEELHNELSSRA